MTYQLAPHIELLSTEAGDHPARTQTWVGVALVTTRPGGLPRSASRSLALPGADELADLRKEGAAS